VRVKQALRAEQIARAIQSHPDLLETNVRPGSERRFAGFRLGYYYQRFDLVVDGPAAYPALIGDEAPALIRAESWYSSGMGAIAACLLALDQLAPAPARLLALEDTYFETLQLLRSQVRRLRVEEAPDPVALHARLRAGPADAALLLDGISGEDPCVLLERLEPGSLRLLLLDSTCYDRADPRLLSLARAVERLGVPGVLLRSHQKLDHLGIEHGRLGSMVTLIAPTAAPAAHALVRALSDRAATLRRLLGSAPVPAFLLPYAADPGFLALNAERLARMAERNLAAAAWLAARMPPGAVRGSHHGRFFTVVPAAAARVPQARFEEAVEDLASHAAQEGLPARRAASFGFDFAALTVFPDLAAGHPVLRVALADHPWPLCEALCSLLSPWAGGLGG
jgi:hypothetical protein